MESTTQLDQQSRKSSHGGKRAGAGRKTGEVTPAKLELKALALPYVPQMLASLVEIAQNGSSESARVSAIKEIIDRAYGKAPQAIVGDPDAPLEVRVTRIELIAPQHDDSSD